jgi:protein subunit release factor A
MDDEESFKRMMAETDEMLAEFKAIAERSKTDPRTRKKFNKLAPDWVILLVDEIRSSRTAVRELNEASDNYKRANERWKEAAIELQRQLDIVYEEMKQGKSFTELYDKHLRSLILPEDDDDDGPVN